MNYIAYTIGPIYDTIFDTLNDDNKTKKLKAGSYFFSYFMKKLLKNIESDFDILVPFVDNDILKKEYKNLGLFHDRFIASFEGDINKAKETFNKKLQLTFKELAKEIVDESIAKDLAKNMSNHLIVASEDDLKEINNNIIFALNDILDAMELNRSFELEPNKNYIKEYQDNQVKKLDRVKTLEKIGGDFSYYAVVVADGDKMGQKIKAEATDSPKNIQHLSKKLFDFFTKNDDIYKLTNESYKGELIYAGGDDILAFIPVKTEHFTFLDFINTLDKRFKDIVGEDVSLSFGVNIVYYKYPLRRAIDEAFNLLYKAKDYKQNSLAVKVTKHSGQYFDTKLSIKESEYREFKKLIDGVLNNEIVLPHSIQHTLKEYQAPLIEAFKNKKSSIDALFKVVFNDQREEKEQQGIDELKEYIKLIQPQNSDDFNKLFSQISILKHLREDRKWDIY